MIAREKHDERLLCYQLVFKIGLLFPAEKSDIKSSALEVVCKHCGMVARNPDFDIEQFVSKDGCGTRQPVDLLPGLEAHGEGRLDRLRGSPRAPSDQVINFGEKRFQYGRCVRLMIADNQVDRRGISSDRTGGHGRRKKI